MAESGTDGGGWRGRVRAELVEYGIVVAYLTLAFGAFAVYRRLTLAAHGIVLMDYGVALIEGLVLGKVLMIGRLLRLDRGLESRPLWVPTLVKAVLFTVFVIAFKVLEHGVRGLWTGEGFAAGLEARLARGAGPMVADALVVFTALIPFFAIRELGRVLGREKLGALFFRRSRGPEA